MLIHNDWYLDADGVIISFHRLSQFTLNPLKDSKRRFELRVNGRVVDSAEYNGGLVESLPDHLISDIHPRNAEFEPFILKVLINEDEAGVYDPILQKHMTGRWFRMEVKEAGSEWVNEDDMTLNLKPSTPKEIESLIAQQNQ